MILYIWKEEKLSEPRIPNTAIYLKIYSVFKFGGINNDSPYSTQLDLDRKEYANKNYKLSSL